MIIHNIVDGHFNTSKHYLSIITLGFEKGEYNV
jgi:hypothetical protein